ncbi:hypothetical protein [Piscinibacter sp. XHJ-5]|uniref:hypothetical protein n=1 Tax=Piscinibacter sp. XHJ-5 TaxID=3037797 RepID=UPI00245373D4|nr:hypothetical protein [Piscinibacter sp. XHJ-5]
MASWADKGGATGVGIPILLVLICIAVVDWLVGPLVAGLWWPRAWVAVSAACAALLWMLRKEEHYIAALGSPRRLRWRVFAALAWVMLVFSVLQWPAMPDVLRSLDPRTKPVPARAANAGRVSLDCVARPSASGTAASAGSAAAGGVLVLECNTAAAAASPSDQASALAGSPDKIQEDLNRWGTLFAWLLAAVALVIAFVTSWVYAIAKEAKDQVTAVQGALDLNARVREARSSLARVELHAHIANLLDELDPESDHLERQRLRSIRNLIATGESLLAPATDMEEAAAVLNAKAVGLGAPIDRPLDPRYHRLVRNDLSRYLQNLHERLVASELSHRPAGEACVAQVERLWRICAD